MGFISSPNYGVHQPEYDRIGSTVTHKDPVNDLVSIETHVKLNP